MQTCKCLPQSNGFRLGRYKGGGAGGRVNSYASGARTNKMLSSVQQNFSKIDIHLRRSDPGANAIDGLYHNQ